MFFLFIVYILIEYKKSLLFVDVFYKYQMNVLIYKSDFNYIKNKGVS
jgi:hypothetical protein